MTPGYFNATDLIPEANRKTLKVFQFCDNQEVILAIERLNKPKVTHRGRNGFTELPLELKSSFTNWVQKSLAGHKVTKGLQLDLPDL